MPYTVTINKSALSASDKQQLIREFDTIKADLTDMRAKFAILLAKLDLDATVTDTNYAALAGFAAATFVSV
jgi:hypothetical protein